MHFTKCLKILHNSFLTPAIIFGYNLLCVFNENYLILVCRKSWKLKNTFFTQAKLLIIKNLKISSIFFVTTRLVFSTKTMLPRIDTSQILVNWILIFFPYIMCKNWRWFLLSLCKKEIKTTLREVSVFNVPGLAHLLTPALVVKIRTIQFLKFSWASTNNILAWKPACPKPNQNTQIPFWELFLKSSHV